MGKHPGENVSYVVFDDDTNQCILTPFYSKVVLLSFLVCTVVLPFLVLLVVLVSIEPKRLHSQAGRNFIVSKKANDRRLSDEGRATELFSTFIYTILQRELFNRSGSTFWHLDISSFKTYSNWERSENIAHRRNRGDQRSLR